MRFPLFFLLLAVSACRPAASTPSYRELIPAESKGALVSAGDLPLIDFTLTERSKAKVGKKDLLGKVWVASFVFTRCTGSCPQVTATVARLQSELTDCPDVRLVTFTVDPERDDPAELEKYAQHFRADKDRWLFLTGGEKEIHRLLFEGFKVPIARNPEPKKGQEDFDHSARLVVIDKHGDIRGYFDGMGPNPETPVDLAPIKKLIDNLRRE